MKTTTKEILVDAADRLLFTMSDEQLKTLEEEFRVFIKLVRKIEDVEGLDEYQPMVFPFDCATDFLREDEPSKALEREIALKNAGNVQKNQIKLPKVIQ